MAAGLVQKCSVIWQLRLFKADQVQVQENLKFGITQVYLRLHLKGYLVGLMSLISNSFYICNEVYFVVKQDIQK